MSVKRSPVGENSASPPHTKEGLRRRSHPQILCPAQITSHNLPSTVDAAMAPSLALQFPSAGYDAPPPATAAASRTIWLA